MKKLLTFIDLTEERKLTAKSFFFLFPLLGPPNSKISRRDTNVPLLWEKVVSCIIICPSFDIKVCVIWGEKEEEKEKEKKSQRDLERR